MVMEQKMIIINKFFPLETKINTLTEIIRELEIEMEEVPEELHSLLNKVKAS